MSAPSLRDSPLIGLLESTPIKEIIPESHALVHVDISASLEDALRVLSTNKILSAPVRDLEAENPLIGFIDMLDIVSYVVSVYASNKEVDVNGVKVNWVSWCQDIAKLAKEGLKFAQKPVGECIDLSTENPFVPIYGHATLLQLTEIFGRGIHRAPVMNAASKVEQVISQGTLMRWMGENIQLLGRGLASASISSLGLGTVKPITMLDSRQTIHGFYLIRHHKVSAIGVVQSNGELVGNLSATDLRGLTQENFAALLLNVSEYLHQRNPKSMIPITCSASTTVETAILKLAATKVHRLWVVNELNVPTGVITLTDIIRLFNV